MFWYTDPQAYKYIYHTNSSIKYPILQIIINTTNHLIENTQPYKYWLLYKIIKATNPVIQQAYDIFNFTIIILHDQSNKSKIHNLTYIAWPMLTYKIHNLTYITLQPSPALWVWLQILRYTILHTSPYNHKGIISMSMITNSKIQNTQS